MAEITISGILLDIYHQLTHIRENCNECNATSVMHAQVIWNSSSVGKQCVPEGQPLTSFPRISPHFLDLDNV